MIRAADHDTAEPRAIDDWEMTNDMTCLPPYRPLSQETPMAYLIAKGRILKAFGGILDFLGSLRPDSYDAVLDLEEALSQARSQVPPHLLLSSPSNSADDHPSLISRRVQLEFMYHQGMCVLHRRFFTAARLDNRFSNSRARCIESAVALLSLQDMLHREANARGSMIASHWFRIPLASHDFILAAVILCLELRWREEEEGSKETTIPQIANNTQQRAVVLQSLQTSCKVWKEVQSSSVDARKVYRVLSSMLETLGVGDEVCSSALQDETPTSTSPDVRQPFLDCGNEIPLDGDFVSPTEDIDWVSQPS